MKVSDFKQKVKGKIESESIVYSIGCKDCVSYSYSKGTSGLMNYSATVVGLIGGEEKEFYTLESANAAVLQHAKDNPLHKPAINSRKTEYLIREKRHLIKYRTIWAYDNKKQELQELEPSQVQVYSVNGYRIASDKHAYECLECGAIYQSKGATCHTIFPTDDPLCNEETHYDARNARILVSNRLCLCLTIEEREEEWDKELRAEGCFYCKRKFVPTMFNANGINVEHLPFYRDYKINAYVCGMCDCLKKGKHDWDKIGRQNFICQRCNLRSRNFNKIVRTKKPGGTWWKTRIQPPYQTRIC